MTVIPRQNLSAVTDRKPSPAVWSWLDKHLPTHMPGKFFHFFDDFFNAGAAAESNTIFAWTGGTPPMPYKGYGTSGITMKALRSAADDEIGVLRIDTDADNDEGYLQFDQTYSNPIFKMSDTSGDKVQCAFETRVRFSKVDGSGAYAIGLRDANDAANLDIPDGGASIDLDEFVGFRAISGDSDGMDAVHRDDGNEVVVKEATADGAPDGMTLTAETWVKLGVRFDGTKCWWYVNNQLVNRNAGVEPGDTNFPDADPLTPFIGGRCDATADYSFDVDWLRMAVLLDPVGS